ncbi:hypothetical protein H7J86_03680 [Mycobacterium hackensackense]|uniref:hypothetical protein n=1 Tax=Mycobacterium hackensackense TaxID=228909 RepID=UPI002265E8C6|nr:hypothetical protein [Mycobacterium hackensackense]MCV7251252.1 hypothetical protein [Mycobacterium hackensackense]
MRTPSRCVPVVGFPDRPIRRRRDADIAAPAALAALVVAVPARGGAGWAAEPTRRSR